METEIDGMKLIVQSNEILVTQQIHEAAIRFLLSQLGKDTRSGTLEIPERWLNPPVRR
jgi:hypothetical protein